MKFFTCPRCDYDKVEFPPDSEVTRCDECGIALELKVTMEWMGEEAGYVDVEYASAIPCDCHMRSQHHEPTCPSQGIV